MVLICEGDSENDASSKKVFLVFFIKSDVFQTAREGREINGYSKLGKCSPNCNKDALPN